jgi:hypothetical protein
MNEDTIEDKRDPGFYIIDDEIIDEYGAQLGPLGVAVYNVLVKHANRHGKSSFPSYQTIADKLGISRNSAIAGVKVLLKFKVIGKRARTNESGAPASNSYKILPVKKQPKEGQEVVQNLNHPPGEIIGHGSANSALGSANGAPPLVQTVHHGSANSAPEPDSSNQTPLNQTTPPHAGDGGSGGVLTISDFLSYARSKKSFHSPEVWAKTALRDMRPEDVQLVREHMAAQAPEAVEARRRAPADNTMSLPAARDHVRSVLRVGARTDPVSLVEQLHSTKKITVEVKKVLLGELPEIARQARAPAVA